MNACQCAFGYQAASADDLTDHLHEAFSRPDHVAPDGREHTIARLGRQYCNSGLSPPERLASYADSTAPPSLAVADPAAAQARAI